MSTSAAYTGWYNHHDGRQRFFLAGSFGQYGVILLVFDRLKKQIEHQQTLFTTDYP